MTVVRKKSLKQKILDLLVEDGRIPFKFTGEISITLEVNQGGVRDSTVTNKTRIL